MPPRLPRYSLRLLIVIVAVLTVVFASMRNILTGWSGVVSVTSEQIAGGYSVQIPRPWLSRTFSRESYVELQIAGEITGPLVIKTTLSNPTTVGPGRFEQKENGFCYDDTLSIHISPQGAVSGGLKIDYSFD